MQSIFVVIIRHQITTFLFCIFCAYITVFNAAEYIFILKTKRATLYKLNPFHVNTAYCLIYYKVLPSVRVPAVSQSVWIILNPRVSCTSLLLSEAGCERLF